MVQVNSKTTTEPQHGLTRLALVASGICVCYLYYGYLQERLFTGKERLGASFVLATQTVTNIIVALLWKMVQPSDTADKRPLNHPLLLLTSAFYMTAMVCSNEAIQYVSYPMAVLAKSCKLVPTMLVGQFLEGRMHSFDEWAAALCISAGIAIFHFSRMTKDSLTSDDGSIYGMILLVASLTMDGVLSSCQNFIKKKSGKTRPPNATETMLYINIYSLLFIVPLCIYNKQWEDGMARLFTEDMALKILYLNLTVGFGQICIFLCLTWYSPVVTTTITTTRKFFTILISVLSFGHTFSTIQWAGIVLVFGGLYLSILHQQKSKVKKD